MTKTTGILNNLRAAIPSRWQATPRSLWIPATLVTAALGIYIGIALTTLTARFTQSPGQHAAVIPDDADLFVAVDLRALSRQPVADILSRATKHSAGQTPTDLLSRHTGLDWTSSQPAEWAGRELSVSVYPDGSHAIVADIRNHRLAARQLDSYLASPPEGYTAALLTRYLIIANSADTAEAIVRRTDEARHNVLTQTSDYRAAVAQHNSGRPVATIFVRWTLHQQAYARSYAGLIGCNPDAWLTGTVNFAANRIEAAAYCPATPGIAAPKPLTPSQAQPPASPNRTQPPPAFWFASSFTPTSEYIHQRTANTGDPGFTLLDLILNLTVIPTTAWSENIQAALLQNLDGYFSLAARQSAEGSPAMFRAVLGIGPDGRQPITESISEIAEALASAYGIQAARQTTAGWLIIHPALPDQTIHVTVADQELAITNATPDEPTSPTDATKPPALPQTAGPAHTTIYAAEPYAAALIANMVPQSESIAEAVESFAYSAYNDGNFLRHRLTLHIREDAER